MGSHRRAALLESHRLLKGNEGLASQCLYPLAAHIDFHTGNLCELFLQLMYIRSVWALIFSL